MNVESPLAECHNCGVHTLSYDFHLSTMTTVWNPTMSSNPSISMAGVYCVVLFLLEGLQRVSGIFFLETKESLGSTRLLAVIPFVLSRATAYFVGVALEYWRRKLKSGTWIIIGSLISATGIGLCFLTTDIIWWSVCWGIIFGAGMGIASPTLDKELTEHNSETVSSLKSTSSSVGCIILPFVISTLIANYGLNGCYLAFSGLILNCIPLTLLAIYQINFSLPKIKWPLRKRSKLYQMSEKQTSENHTSPQTNAHKVLSDQSFICSLEPDALQKVSESEGHDSKHDGKDVECINIFKPIIEAKLNMEMDGINGREANCPGRDIKKVSHSKQEEYYKGKLSELLADIKNYEKNRMMFEESFSHSDAMSESPVESSLKNEMLSNVDGKSEKQNHGGSSSVEDSEAEINTSSEKEPRHESECSRNIPQKQNNMKTGAPKALRLNIPLEIKVHVVECTVTTNEEYLETPPINQVLSPRTNGYRRHSNSLISGSYDNIDFSKMFQHKNSKPTPMHKLECHLTSKMFLITEDDEFDSGYRNSLPNSHDVEASRENNSPKNPRSNAQAIYELAKPSCLVIVYTTVIFEFTLALLLTMFADFAKDNDGSTMSSNFVLVAFGVGGIIGQLSCSFWGNRLLVDGSHAATAVMLMLNGLAVAGILWSTNVCWLSGFFGIFGFIESGILLTFPRLVSDYIEKKAEKVLSLTCRSFSGIAMMCVPFAIGFSRDAIGEYDGLLQVTSCLSVLCAVLCYFLPRITKRPEQTSSQP